MGSAGIVDSMFFAVADVVTGYAAFAGFVCCSMVAVITHIVAWGFTCSYVMRFVDIKSFA